MSKTIQDHITDALEELTERDLKKFKTKLCDRLGEPKIRKGVIETAEPADLAHKIVRTYTECKAAPVTVEVLQAIDENQIAEELRQNTIALTGNSVTAGLAAATGTNATRPTFLLNGDLLADTISSLFGFNLNRNSNSHIANATGKPLRIFYQRDLMRLDDVVVEVGKDASSDGSGHKKKLFNPRSPIPSVRLPINDYIKIQGQGTFYISVFVEDVDEENSYVETIQANFQVPSDRSIIVTANLNIKFQKYGASCWEDDLGNIHR